jgi:hypothetical protein
VALSFLPSASAQASLADGFGVRPVVPPGADTPPAYFELEVKPGQVLTRSVVTSNGSKEPMTYRIDSVDGLSGQTSGVVYGNRQDKRKEAGNWIEVDSKAVTLAPGATKRLRFTIRVPKNVRNGDHLAGIAFEDTKTESTKSKFSVKQVIRVVMGVQFKIKGGKPAQIALSSVKLQPLADLQVPSAVIRLGNRGDKLCKPNLRVALTSASGKETVADNQLDTLLAHDKISYPITFKGALEAGEYAAKVDVTKCGAPQSITTRAVLKDDLTGDLPTATTSVATTEASTGLPLWATILIALGGAMTGVNLLLFVQRRRKRTDG